MKIAADAVPHAQQQADHPAIAFPGKYPSVTSFRADGTPRSARSSGSAGTQPSCPAVTAGGTHGRPAHRPPIAGPVPPDRQPGVPGRYWQARHVHDPSPAPFVWTAAAARQGTPASLRNLPPVPRRPDPASPVTKIHSQHRECPRSPPRSRSQARRMPRSARTTRTSVSSFTVVHIGGSRAGPQHRPSTLRASARRGRAAAKPLGRTTPAETARLVSGLRGRVTGRQADRFGMGQAVVLGQGLAEAAGPVRDGAAADLAARDRKMGNGHGETAGTGLAHRLHDASPARLTLRPPRACRSADAAALDGAGPGSYRPAPRSRLSVVEPPGPASVTSPLSYAALPRQSALAQVA